MPDLPADPHPPASTEQEWASYHAATTHRPPRPLLVRAAEIQDARGVALDLGCGAGNDTRYLLARGYTVTAIDTSPGAIAILHALAHPLLTPVQATFADAPLDAAGYDLITAQYALPFNPPSTFTAMLTRILAALRPGGIFTANLFGVRDAWNQSGSGMTFHTRAHVEALLTDLDVLVLDEIEKPVRLANGHDHHGHAFDIIARKIAASPAGR